MSALLMLSILLIYFAGLYAVAHFTSKGANEHSFFIGNRNSTWWVVAYGMIGTSLSGVTFMSVPGQVGAKHFIYFGIVIGYFLGYIVVAKILLPLYYRLQLTSIYNYLLHRFGDYTYKTGAIYFIISRTVGATLRMYLVINVLQIFILDAWHVPFAVTTLIVLVMILLYTYKGGVKTIVWTDMLQTTFMIAALLGCVFYILKDLNLNIIEMFKVFEIKNYNQIFETDINNPKFFIKQIIGGAFVTIAMTGLDQEMMQKNISCKNIGEAQKNMLSFSVVLVLVNFVFLCLGGLLFLYAEKLSIPIPKLTDDLFPIVALNYLPPIISILFIVGLISALFPSADGAITALTSSFCLDVLQIDKRQDLVNNKIIRKQVQLVFLVVFLIFILIFKWINQRAIIDLLLDLAGYTYGPLLGLFAFGIFSKNTIKDKWAPIVCFMAPVISYGISLLSKYDYIFGGYKIGVELLVINAILTYIGLWLISKPNETYVTK